MASTHREEHQEHLRRADELDPDVNTKSDDYVGPGSTHGTGQGSSHSDGQERAQDRLGGSEGQERTTVTHPDGSTETVNDSNPSRTQSDTDTTGGSHRA